MLVELDALGLPHAGVKLEGAVIARPEGCAVIDCIIQEPCICGGRGGTRTSNSVCTLAPHGLPRSRWREGTCPLALRELSLHLRLY